MLQIRLYPSILTSGRTYGFSVGAYTEEKGFTPIFGMPSAYLLGAKISDSFHSAEEALRVALKQFESLNNESGLVEILMGDQFTEQGPEVFEEEELTIADIVRLINEVDIVRIFWPPKGETHGVDA